MKKEPKIKIFVSHHKPGYIYEDDVYVPIQVGKKNSKVDLGILGDDTGDNISEKNNNYAELTAQYWVWKNYDLSNVDYVGFCHYRRYFSYGYKSNCITTIKLILTKLRGLYNKALYARMYILGSATLINWNYKLITTFSNIKLCNYIIQNNKDIYTFKPVITNKPFYHFHLNNEKIRAILENIIIHKYPSYIKTEKGMRRTRKFSGCNMFIMKKELFYEYSEWLFDILMELETQIIQNDLKKEFLKEDFVAGDRFIGCISERLFNLRFTHQSKIGNTVSTILGTFHIVG